MARRLGATDQQIVQLERGETTEFPIAWQEALGAAERLTRDGGRIAGESYAALATHWSPGQIIEIICVIALFNYFNRFANALDIPPTK